MELKLIPAYLNYAASAEGFVYNKTTGRRLKGVPNTTDKRLRVCMPVAKGKYRYVSVHRLVFSAFNPDVKLTSQAVIHHKNENYLDNTPGNLILFEGGAGRHRSHHFKIEKTKNWFPHAKLTVVQISSICEDIAAGQTDMEISRKYGCLRRTVSYIRCGKQWTGVSQRYLTNHLERSETIPEKGVGSQALWRIEAEDTSVR